jgi:hypothetical protein
MHWARSVSALCGQVQRNERRASVFPQKLDERNKRVTINGPIAKALCLRPDRFVKGNKNVLALNANEPAVQN